MCLCVFYGYSLWNVKAVLIWNPDVSGFVCPSTSAFNCFSANILRFSVLQRFSELKKIISQVLNRIVVVQSGLEVHKSSHRM